MLLRTDELIPKRLCGASALLFVELLPSKNLQPDPPLFPKPTGMSAVHSSARGRRPERISTTRDGRHRRTQRSAQRPRPRAPGRPTLRPIVRLIKPHAHLRLLHPTSHIPRPFPRPFPPQRPRDERIDPILDLFIRFGASARHESRVQSRARLLPRRRAPQRAREHDRVRQRRNHVPNLRRFASQGREREGFRAARRRFRVRCLQRYRCRHESKSLFIPRGSLGLSLSIRHKQTRARCVRCEYSPLSRPVSRSLSLARASVVQFASRRGKS